MDIGICLLCVLSYTSTHLDVDMYIEASIALFVSVSLVLEASLFF